MNVHELLEYGVIVASDSTADIVITWNDDTDGFNIFEGGFEGEYQEYDYSVIPVGYISEAVEAAEKLIVETAKELNLEG